MTTALDRLFEDAAASSNMESKYTLDEQLEHEDDDFISSMSNESKDVLLQRIQKVELDEETDETLNNEENDTIDINPTEEILNDMLTDESNDVSVEEEKEEEKEEKPKRGRGRPRKNPVPEEKVESKSNKETKSENINSIDKFMDSLARDLIVELKKTDYTIKNFSKEQMLVILNHIETKL